jgi:hypothetical protein
MFSLHGAQDHGAFELLGGRRHVEELPYKQPQAPLALSPVVTREAALQVGLDIQALFHL